MSSQSRSKKSRVKSVATGSKNVSSGHHLGTKSKAVARQSSPKNPDIEQISCAEYKVLIFDGDKALECDCCGHWYCYGCPKVPNKRTHDTIANSAKKVMASCGSVLTVKSVCLICKNC